MYEHLAQLAEKISREIHAECPDPQEDASEITGEKIAEAIRAADLQWTTEPPKEPGWYWVKFSDKDNPACLEIEITLSGLPMFRDFADILGNGLVSHWLGPLPVPPNP